MTTKQLDRGLFIVFEGGEGSGKSTLAKLLASALTDEGYSVVLTREPGGTKGAEEIRNLLVTGDKDRWDPYTETMLFFAARRDHWQRVILPALKEKKIVICDRYIDSTIVYQSSKIPDTEEHQDRFEKLVTSLIATVHAQENDDEPENCLPDITLTIDIDPEIGLDRANTRNNVERRFEDHDLSYHRKIRKKFNDLHYKNWMKDNREFYSGSLSIETLQDEILEDVNAYIDPFLKDPRHGQIGVPLWWEIHD